MGAMMNTSVSLKGFLCAIAAACGLALSATSSAGTVTYYHNDLLGSPVVATDSSGKVLWRESYRPYGERTKNAPASSGNDVWFTSRRQDADTGLVYMGARYYDPVAGRFVSMDPKGFDEANVHSHNRYVYGNNNPFKFIDPNGKDAVLLNRRDGSLTVILPMLFGGAGANAAAIGAIKGDIETAWSGAFTINGRQTSVNTIVIESPLIGVQNSITLTVGPTSYEELQGASFVRNASTGEWNVISPGMQQREAAHEAGHLLGLPDRYQEAGIPGNRLTKPHKGFEENLMGRLGGRVTADDISNIRRSPVNRTINE